MRLEFMLSAAALMALVIPASNASEMLPKRSSPAPDTRVMEIAVDPSAKFIGAVTGRVVLVCNISPGAVGWVDEHTSDDGVGNARVSIPYGSCATLDGDKKPRVASGDNKWTALLISYFKEGQPK